MSDAAIFPIYFFSSRFVFLRRAKGSAKESGLLKEAPPCVLNTDPSFSSKVRSRRIVGRLTYNLCESSSTDIYPFSLSSSKICLI